MLQRIGRKLRREWGQQERRQRLPEQTVLLLTNPRSDGTWLFSAAFPGFILDYDALEADLPRALKRIFAWLWPGKLPSSDPDLLSDITAAIEPHKRGATLFFRATPTLDDSEALEGLFAQHAVDLEACYTAHRPILARAAGDATA